MTKRLTKHFIAATLFLCFLLVGLCFILPDATKKADAFTANGNTLTLNSTDDFVIENGVLSGISGNATTEYNNTLYENIVVTIPSDVTKIAGSAFNGCAKIKSITIPDSVVDIGVDAFFGTAAIESETGVYYVDNWVVGYDAAYNDSGLDGEITLRDNTVGIADEAIRSAPKLTKIIMPNTMKYIGNSAFNGCAKIKSITIPDSVVDIGVDAFFGTAAIESETGVYYVDNWVVGYDYAYNGSGLEGEITLRDNTVGIADEAISLTQKLTKIIMPNTMKYIGNSAFLHSKILKEVEIKNVKKIGESAFEDCKQLEKVSINGTDCVIGNSAFAQLENLMNVTISGTVRSINRLAFDVCPKLSNLNITATVGSIGDWAFDECPITELSFKKGLTSIGMGAFYACEQLKKVIIPSGVQVIEEYTFASCNSLQEIEIPNTVKTIMKHGDNGEYAAFCDSKNIIKATVPVVALDHMTFGSTLTNLTINGGDIPADRLKNLTGLKSVTLTKDVVRVGASSFDGCINLKNVTYESADTAWDDNAFTNCGNPIFIAGDSAVYLKAADNENLKKVLGSRTLTYPIKITLNGLDSVIAAERLYGKEYNFVEKDGVWDTDTNVKLPVQSGYSTSMWFNNSDYDGNSAPINTWLAKQTTENASTLKDELNLYVLNLNVEDVDGLQTKELTYAYDFEIVPDANKDISQDAFVDNFLNGSLPDGLNGKLVYKLINYKGASGAPAVNLPVSIKDAGTYTIEISLKAKYGAWNTKQKKEIKINKAQLDLYDINNLDFSVTPTGGTAGTDLQGGTNTTIYLYKYDDTDRVYPSLIPISRPGGLPGDAWNQVDTIASPGLYTRFTGGELGLSIKPKSDYFIITGHSNETGNDIGDYKSTYTITPTNNYSFSVSHDQNDISSAQKRKLTVAINADGTATIYKVWYILAQVGYLVNAAGGSYSIPDFVFGNDALLSAPSLNYGNDNTKNSITFELKLGDTPITANDGVRISQFGDYINKSMPVGRYVITFNVPAYADTATNVNIDAFSESYSFNVTKGRLSVTDTALRGKSFDAEYKDGVGVNIFDYIKQNIEISYVGRTGVWKDPGRDNYYDYATPKIRLARMSGGTYYEKSEFDTTYASLIAPGNNATYTVYYKLDGGSNYNEFLSGNDMFSSYYYVTVFKTISAPSIDSAIYNGSRLVPSVESNENYSITLPHDCVSAGKYDVVFTLYDRVHFKWKESAGVTIDETNGTAIVEFVIDKADNTWLRVPNIVGWEYGSFDTEVNRIRAVAQYSQSTISFAIEKADGTAMENLGAFVVSADGKIDTENESLVSALNGLKAGDYKLVVTVVDTANYKALSSSVDFRIGKAINTWKDGNDDLMLPSWIVGKYSAENNPIVIKAANGIVDILVTDIDGNVYYNSKTGLDKLNECTVGKYLVKASVEETADYAALAERTFTIEVLERVGLPWWVTLLVTVGALALAALVIFILWKKGVFKIVTDKIILAIKTRISVEATIAAVRTSIKMEEGKKSIAEARRRERIEEARKKAQELRALPPEKQAALLEEKAHADEVRADRMHERAENKRKKAEVMRGKMQTAEGSTAENVADDIEKQ